MLDAEDAASVLGGVKWFVLGLKLFLMQIGLMFNGMIHCIWRSVCPCLCADLFNGAVPGLFGSVLAGVMMLAGLAILRDDAEAVQGLVLPFAVMSADRSSADAGAG
ncbi:hypothetical protein Nepgr_017431 [Nepenthes gracilis]|uniref:Uncharacterized protein n=1 Tax=Nepenthes gracilis TaxID=150966 RepID=A0AAD3SPE8_NEPGR|nr:hypothetical protein Nepgr_017431 [Nepenthes gracilis]